MAEISVQSILDGVCTALSAAFPPPAQIHSGGAQTDLKAGDCYVAVTGAEHSLEVGRRYKRTPTLEVLYSPHEGAAECCAMADRLTGLLESITTPEGDVVHATSCAWTVQGGVLHVLVAYSHFTYQTNEQIRMEELNIGQGG